MKYYPAFLDLKNKKAVVVGGGGVAERKARLLIRAGARVTLISPDITPRLSKLADQGRIRHLMRKYRKGDLKEAFIVVAATSSAATNRKIAREAPHCVNVVTMPSEGNYIVPSVVKRGLLTIAISTEGASPALSKAVRKEIERHFNRDFVLYLRFVEKIREDALKTIKHTGKCEKFLKSLASPEILAALRIKGFRAVRHEILSSLERIQ